MPRSITSQGGRILRNRWPDKIGIDGRILSESVAGSLRNTHAEALATLGSKLGYYANELARRDDDTCAYWSDQLTKLRGETQSALELRVRARWQSVCAQHKQQHEKSL